MAHSYPLARLHLHVQPALSGMAWDKRQDVKPAERGRAATTALLVPAAAICRHSRRQLQRGLRATRQRCTRTLPLEEQPPLEQCGRQQRVALPPAQGPPGTGKTRTLHALIQMVAACDNALMPGGPHQKGQVLAVAGTNAAADNLLEGLVASVAVPTTPLLPLPPAP